MLLWAFLTHYIACEFLCLISFLFGHPQPIFFPWASFAHFLILHSHGLLPTLLDFPDPITLSFILGARGLSINPLLFYFITSGLLWLILTFLHHIMPIGLLLLPLEAPLGPFSFLKAHLFTLWTYNPLFLPFGFNGSSINPLTLLYPYCWASSCYWASKMSINKVHSKLTQK